MWLSSTPYLTFHSSIGCLVLLTGKKSSKSYILEVLSVLSHNSNVNVPLILQLRRSSTSRDNFSRKRRGRQQRIIKLCRRGQSVRLQHHCGSANDVQVKISISIFFYFTISIRLFVKY